MKVSLSDDNTIVHVDLFSLVTKNSRFKILLQILRLQYCWLLKQDDTDLVNLEFMNLTSIWKKPTTILRYYCNYLFFKILWWDILFPKITYKSTFQYKSVSSKIYFLYDNDVCNRIQHCKLIVGAVLAPWSQHEPMIKISKFRIVRNYWP